MARAKKTKAKKAAPKELPSAFSLFKPSYDALMLNIWTFLGLLGLPIAGFMLGTILLTGASNHGLAPSKDVGPAGLLLMVGVSLLTVALAPALPYVQLKSVRGKQVTFNEALRASKEYFWRFWILSIMVAAIVLVGFLLLIVPGFFMIKRYFLASFYLYDKNVSVGKAMRLAAADASKYSGAIWGILGVTLLINVPSLLPLFSIVTIVLSIVYYCAPAVRYRQITAGRR